MQNTTKLMIASDIHGSAPACEALMKAFAREGAQRLVLLGDLLYHGPRNDLPEGYDPKRVAALLGSDALSGRIIAVRGNCDSEVDQMMLPFPILAREAVLFADGYVFRAVHGHLPLPPLCPGDVVLQGHTHIPRAERADGCVFLNPGSAAIPKEGSTCGYLVYEAGVFAFKELSGQTYREYALT